MYFIIYTSFLAILCVPLVMLFFSIDRGNKKLLKISVWLFVIELLIIGIVGAANQADVDRNSAIRIYKRRKEKERAEMKDSIESSMKKQIQFDEIKNTLNSIKTDLDKIKTGNH